MSLKLTILHAVQSSVILQFTWVSRNKTVQFDKRNITWESMNESWMFSKEIKRTYSHIDSEYSVQRQWMN